MGPVFDTVCVFPLMKLRHGPEDQGEGGHQEVVSALPVPHPHQTGLQGTQAASPHTA